MVENPPMPLPEGYTQEAVDSVALVPLPMPTDSAMP